MRKLTNSLLWILIKKAFQAWKWKMASSRKIHPLKVEIGIYCPTIYTNAHSHLIFRHFSPRPHSPLLAHTQPSGLSSERIESLLYTFLSSRSLCWSCAHDNAWFSLLARVEREREGKKSVLWTLLEHFSQQNCVRSERARERTKAKGRNYFKITSSIINNVNQDVMML